MVPAWLKEKRPDLLNVWISLKREINWKIDKPFNFNKAKLAKVRGNVNKKVTKEDVNKAYVKIQKKIHPDISPETSRLSSIVNEAKDIVLNDIS